MSYQENNINLNKVINEINLKNVLIDIDCFKNHNNKHIISLNDIKQICGFNSKNIINYNVFHNFYNSYCKFDSHHIKRLYFHYIIAIGDYMNVNNFIINYINSTSIYAFESFLNTPLYVPILLNNKSDTYNLYPITTCVMWNNDPQLVRLLIMFGGVVSEQDNFGYYPEETIQHISYFNPIPFLDNFKQHENIKKINETIHYRITDDFNKIIDEMKYITGEKINKDWFYPI